MFDLNPFLSQMRQQHTLTFVFCTKGHRLLSDSAKPFLVSLGKTSIFFAVPIGENGVG